MGAETTTRQSTIGLLICAIGGLPMLLVAPLCAQTSQLAACLCGPLPWLFAAAAMFSLADERRDQRAWILTLTIILLIDAWLAIGAVASRQLYYQVMVFAIPFVNMALLLPAWLLVLGRPLLRRLRRPRPVRVSRLSRRTNAV